MKVELYGTPPSLNHFAGRENAWEYRGTKAKWTERTAWACMASKDRPEQPFPYAEVRITYYFKTNIRHDADNYCGKFLLDGLTKAGVIVDDDMRHIRLVVDGGWDPERPRTVISVEEVQRGDPK